MTKAAHMASDAIERKAEKEKKKLKKKVKRTVRRIIRGIFWTVLILCLGMFIGVHKNVISAWLKGEKLPEMPSGHCHYCK